MIAKQQIRISYLEVSYIIRYQKDYWQLLVSCLAMITKEQIRINDIEEIIIKSDEKRDEILSDMKNLL